MTIERSCATMTLRACLNQGYSPLYIHLDYLLFGGDSIAPIMAGTLLLKLDKNSPLLKLSQHRQFSTLTAVGNV